MGYGGIIDPAFVFHIWPQPRHITKKRCEEDDENPGTAKKTQIFPGDCQGYPVGCYGQAGAGRDVLRMGFGRSETRRLSRIVIDSWSGLVYHPGELRASSGCLLLPRVN